MARSGSRFNKILEFIGLVDDEPDEEMDRDRGRPAGTQSYSAQPRRSQQSAPAPRAQRPSDYDQSAPGGRYTSSPRPDYDARARRGDYASASRYAAPRTDYPPYDRAAGRAPEYERSSSARPAEYDRPASRPSDYDRASGYRAQARPDPIRDEFERAERAPARPSRADAERTRDNVVSMRADARQQTVIYYLRSLEECRDVINDLLDSKTVLLNLEDMDERMMQRGIDTLCGAAFALHATLRKASDKTYLIAPNNVEVASPNDTERRF